MAQALGPLEYIVVGFNGNKFKGEIVPALKELVDDGLIRIIDLAVVVKDGRGDLTTFEASELSPPVAKALAKLGGKFTGLLSEADLLTIGELMEDNSTAAAMLFEHVWATKFAKAVRSAKGELLASVRIPSDVVEAVRQTVIEAAARA